MSKLARILMCPPDYFDVLYEINDWMHLDDPVDSGKAKAEWRALQRQYLELGYEVEIVEPVAGLPDMVFSANGGLVYGDKAVVPHFRFGERRPELKAFEAWFKDHGYKTFKPEKFFEGEGDALFISGRLYGGHGFRSDPAVYPEIADFLGVEVKTLELIDPRFYHLDTCLSVLGPSAVAFYPGAFSNNALKTLRNDFEMAIEVPESEAVVFGLNMFSDGINAVVCSQAPEYRRQLKDIGLHVYPVDVSEFKKSGGGIKCMSLRLNQPYA